MTRYAVRTKPCGCIAEKPEACPDQTVPLFTIENHANGEVTTVVTAEASARMPLVCREHRAKEEPKQEGLFG